MSHFILTTMYQASIELINNTPVWYASDEEKALMNQLLQDTAQNDTQPNAPHYQDLLALSKPIMDNIKLK
ncbi:hypothetical protein [Faucicola atlantae]|uniref:hypothetical protein n=1 Tax=Faucicola atlantae TaxID=34059 RepID=UPI0025B0E513|nr:hypothetical protein [Moraxella atlantae]